MKYTSTLILTLVTVAAFSFSGCSGSADAPEEPSRTKNDAKILADELYTRLTKGEDFAALANEYSEDPGSNTIGGRYDDVKMGIMVPEFEAVIFSLKENEVSQPFLTEYGYHIATVVAIRGDSRDIRHILIQFKN